MSGKLDAVILIGPLKARIARLLSALNASEERLECLVESTHGRLGRAEVDPGEVGTGQTLSLEPGRLPAVADGPLLRPVVGLPFIQASVAKPTVGLKHNAEFPLLFRVVQSLYLKVRSIYFPFWFSM